MPADGSLIQVPLAHPRGYRSPRATSSTPRGEQRVLSKRSRQWQELITWIARPTGVSRLDSARGGTRGNARARARVGTEGGGGRRRATKKTMTVPVAREPAVFDGTPRGVSGLLSLRSASFAFIYRCSPPLSSPQSTRGPPLFHLLHHLQLLHRSPPALPTQKLIQNGRSAFARRGPEGCLRGRDRGPVSLTRCRLTCSRCSNGYCPITGAANL